jgi:hypothetical protein
MGSPGLKQLSIDVAELRLVETAIPGGQIDIDVDYSLYST